MSFYGSETATVLPVADDFTKAGDPRNLYLILRQLWSADTCAPRMRERWSTDNPTLGQCSITAFLAQDIYGGKVFGVPLKDGNFHCYNVVGNCVFDLTSEQFLPEKLSYECNPEQFREVHFSKAEKFERYKLLKEGLISLLSDG
jgi:hypothetical protein